MLPRSIEAAAAQIAVGRLRPIELITDCLARIDRYDEQIRAWVVVDRERAIATAEALGAELAARRPRGPLHGIPLGIKDIIDVAGLPTRAGSSWRSAEPVAVDAPVVARLRAAGAIILGKTVTTEFACFDPPPTRNPWNLAHTPGGSSSGSAAAVAAGMCLGAIGTQTGGSINRPASYCGVAGIKPSLGLVSREGIVPVSEHLDHVGPLAHGSDDLAILLSAMTDGRQETMPVVLSMYDEPRLGVVGSFLTEAAPEVREIVQSAFKSLVDYDATLVDADLPFDFDEVRRWHRTIMAVEAAAYHRAEFARRRSAYGRCLAALVDEGLAVDPLVYRQALAEQAKFRVELSKHLAEFDALIAPATNTTAPARLDTTGDARFNSPWSFAGVPAVSFPCGLATDGMPVSLQLICSHDDDSALLGVAGWCESAIGFFARALQD